MTRIVMAAVYWHFRFGSLSVTSCFIFVGQSVCQERVWPFISTSFPGYSL